MEDNLEYPLNINYILRKKKLLKRELLNKDNFIQKNIAILGGSSTSEIVNILEIFLLKNGIKPNFYQSEYNKFYEDALFRTDELAKFNPDIVYIHTTNKNISVYPDIQDSKNDIKILFEKENGNFLCLGDLFRQTKVASGIAKKRPQKPQRPPKNNTAITITTG